MKKLVILVLASLIAAFAAACSTSENTNTPANTAPVNAAPPRTAPKSAIGEDVPADVRAAFPDAQSITKQHKDISSAQIAAIEKSAGSKVPDTDHHSYVAYSTSGGARKQIGAATVVEAGDKKMVVVYESRINQPYIKEVRAEGFAPAFLDQFKDKGADDKFQLGQDLKAQGVADTTAKAIGTSIHIDILTMRTLYGGTQAQ
jgi:hypothetical protein